ncbi:MAG TPA: hypothetical protein VIT44_17970 [Cyclobacteriaceae bacterium]
MRALDERDKLLIGGFIVAIVFIVICFIQFQKWNSKYGDFQSVEIDTQINSTLHILRFYKGDTYLRLKNGEQFVIDDLYNNEYVPKEFNSNVMDTDSIVKRKDSDTIFLYRNPVLYNKKEMYFLLHHN